MKIQKILINSLYKLRKTESHWTKPPHRTGYVGTLKQFDFLITSGIEKKT